jgi:thiol:disulfide interchange protein DsbD
MDVLRKALAFPMYGAAAWLAWVLTVQTGANGIALLLGAAVVLALAAWLAGAAQRRRAAGAGGAALGAMAAALAILALGAAILTPYGAPAPNAASLDQQAYSPERLASLRAEGRAVFVNYTAAWCVSCQVNDRVALSTRAVAEAFHRGDVAYLKADWTRRDPVIAAELARFGRAGVPLYLVYPANGGPPEILPSILTEGVVLKALEGAARGRDRLQARNLPSTGLDRIAEVRR